MILSPPFIGERILARCFRISLTVTFIPPATCQLLATRKVISSSQLENIRHRIVCQVFSLQGRFDNRIRSQQCSEHTTHDRSLCGGVPTIRTDGSGRSTNTEGHSQFKSNTLWTSCQDNNAAFFVLNGPVTSYHDSSKATIRYHFPAYFCAVL